MKILILLCATFVSLLSIPQEVNGFDIKKSIKKAGNKDLNQGEIKSLPMDYKCTSDDSKIDCDLENFSITNEDKSTEIQVYVKYMPQMEIIHKPGIQVKFKAGGITEYGYFGQMSTYRLIFANPGKTNIPLGTENSGVGKWESEDGKEFIKTILVLDGKVPCSAKARVRIKLKDMAKPITKEYKLPFSIIDAANMAPVLIQQATNNDADGCRAAGDECLDNFKIMELDQDQKIEVRPIKRECGDEGFSGRRPCVQIDVSRAGVTTKATHTVGLSQKRKGMAKDNIYFLKDGSSFENEGSWISEDKKSWVKHYLVLDKKAPKARVEIKLRTYGKPLIKEYPLPFEI